MIFGAAWSRYEPFEADSSNRRCINPVTRVVYAEEVTHGYMSGTNFATHSADPPGGPFASVASPS